METEKIDFFNSKSLKVFIKGSLVIIGLFVILYCCVAVLLLYFGNNLNNNAFILILILAIPLIIFLVFLYFANSYCGFFGIKCNGTLLKTHKKEAITEACFLVAKTLKLDSGKNKEALQNLLKEMLLLLLKTGTEDKDNNSEYKILYDNDGMMMLFTKLK